MITAGAFATTDVSIPHTSSFPRSSCIDYSIETISEIMIVSLPGARRSKDLKGPLRVSAFRYGTAETF